MFDISGCVGGEVTASQWRHCRPTNHFKSGAEWLCASFEYEATCSQRVVQHQANHGRMIGWLGITQWAGLMSGSLSLHRGVTSMTLTLTQLRDDKGSTLMKIGHDLFSPGSLGYHRFSSQSYNCISERQGTPPAPDRGSLPQIRDLGIPLQSRLRSCLIPRHSCWRGSKNRASLPKEP